jgi:esterase
MSLFFHQLGEGEPLILLHGLFGMSDNLMPIAREFARNYTVYVPDMPNHGRTEHSKSMDYGSMARDVVLLMDEQGIKQAHILGHSMGGKVAMTMARDYPQRVKSIIVADIAPVSYPPFHEKILKGLFTVLLHQASNRRQADQVLAEFVDDESVRRFLLKSLAAGAEGEAMNWRFNLEGISSDYHKLREGVPFEAPFAGPALFIKGQLSDYITREHEEAIRSCFPEFQFKMIQNAGHWLHAEKPAAFVKLVENFLSDQLTTNETESTESVPG